MYKVLTYESGTYYDKQSCLEELAGFLNKLITEPYSIAVADIEKEWVVIEGRDYNDYKLKAIILIHEYESEDN